MANDARTALFIDGPSLYGAARALGFDMDFRKLLREFERRGRLIRAYYYTVIAEDQEYSSLRPLTDWLAYNGYHVVTKQARQFSDASGRSRLKGSMDVALTVDALELAPHLDEMVLFSSDGDFRPLVEAVQRRGVRVTVVSTVTASTHSVSDDLRRQADVFLDLGQIVSLIGREGERGTRGDAPRPSTEPPPRGGPDLERRYGIRGDEE